MVSGRESLLPLTYRDTISTPAEMNTSPSPALMAWNAIRVVCSDEEQYRVSGDAWQVVEAEQYGDHPGHVVALLAAGQAAAEHQVVDVLRVELGHLVQAARMMVAVRSSGRRSFSDPLNARPIGERAVATMTASGIGTPCLWVGPAVRASVSNLAQAFTPR